MRICVHIKEKVCKQNFHYTFRFTANVLPRSVRLCLLSVVDWYSISTPSYIATEIVAWVATHVSIGSLDPFRGLSWGGSQRKEVTWHTSKSDKLFYFK